MVEGASTNVGDRVIYKGRELIVIEGIKGSINMKPVTRDFSGLKALADVLTKTHLAASLTKLSLAENQLDEQGTKIICEALSTNQRLCVLNLNGTRFGGEGFQQLGNIGGRAGAQHVADMLSKNRSLTRLHAGFNNLGDEGEELLRQAVARKGGAFELTLERAEEEY